MGKIILILGVVAVLGGASYLLWGDTNNSFFVSFLNSATSSAYRVNNSSETTTPETSFTSKATTFLKETGGDVVSWVADTAHSFLSSVSDTAQSEIVGKVKGVAQDTAQSVGESLGVVPSRDIEVEYVLSVGKEGSFAIRDITDSRASTTLSYTINWGDGVIDTKENIMMAYPYICTHTWNTTGVYTILFNILRNESVDTYTMRVVVRE